MPPYVYTPPANTTDIGPDLRALLARGERHIQIDASAATPLGTPVILGNASGPYHGLRIEPRPPLTKVTLDVTGIGLNPNDITDPSYAGFEYNGGFTAASYLTRQALADEQELRVANVGPYSVGDWVYISDASTDPTYLLPRDGPCEVRRVRRVQGSPTNTLLLERALLRGHPNRAAVARCAPIRNLRFRGLEFTGRGAAGIHVHCAQTSTFESITSVQWTGRTMLLVDLGGANNLVLDCYCTGTTPGGAAGENAWGVALEGQEFSRVVRSGGEKCGNGLILIACTATEAYEGIGQECNVNVGIYNACRNSRLIRSRSISPAVYGVVIVNSDASNAIVD